MKKVLSVIVIFLFIHILIFMSCFSYKSFDGVFDFKDITATKQKYQELPLEDVYDLYMTVEFLNIINNCKFESLNMIDALSVINKSNEAISIKTKLIHGESDLFQNYLYMSGNFLIFNADEIYCHATYKDVNSKVSEVSFVRTVYKVSLPENLYAELVSYADESIETDLIKSIMTIKWYEFTLIQKNVFIIVLNILFLMTEIIVILSTLKKRLKK